MCCLNVQGISGCMRGSGEMSCQTGIAWGKGLVKFVNVVESCRLAGILFWQAVMVVQEDGEEGMGGRCTRRITVVLLGIKLLVTDSKCDVTLVVGVSSVMLLWWRLYVSFCVAFTFCSFFCLNLLFPSSVGSQSSSFILIYFR